jgi:O-antigen/teichoic acid export membrane protein
LARSLSYEVGILTLGRIAAYAVMFVVPLVNVRTLSVEEYGYYRQFWLIFETLSPMLILGFPRSLLYHLPRAESREEKAAYLTQTVLFLTLMSLVGVLVYAVMARQLGAGLGAAARAFYWRLSFFTLFMVVTDFMEVLFVAQRQSVAQSVYHATTSAVQAICVIVASYVSRDVSAIVWVLAFFGLARFIFGLGYVHARYRLSLAGVSLHSVREQLSFALPIGLAGVALILVAQTDKFIINRFLGREAFAVYTVGAVQVPFVNIIRTSIGNVTFPMMVQYQKTANTKAMLALWQRSLLKTEVMFFPIFVFLMVSARPFITILFTEQYEAATPVFMMYLLLFLRASVETGTIIQAYKRTMFIFAGFVAGFVTNVVLGLVLFNAMGRLGVPLATVITMNAINAVNLWYSARLIGAGYFDLFPVVELTKRFVAAALPGLLMVLLYRVHPITNFIELCVAGLVYSLMYVAICAVTRLVTVDDVRSLLGRRPI